MLHILPHYSREGVCMAHIFAPVQPAELAAACSHYGVAATARLELKYAIRAH